MAELVDALISGVSGETRADSNSVIRTMKKLFERRAFLLYSRPFQYLPLFIQLMIFAQIHTSAKKEVEQCGFHPFLQRYSVLLTSFPER
jgi:hypothetical protein